MRRRTTQSEPQRLCLKTRRWNTASSESRSPGEKRPLSAHHPVVLVEVGQTTSEEFCGFWGGNSREKQKMVREHGPNTNVNAASESLLESPGKLEAELKVTEAKQRLDKHR